MSTHTHTKNPKTISHTKMVYRVFMGCLLHFVSVFIFCFGFLEAQMVPALYVFGDSLVDVGNNNYLRLSVARADHPYYGIDFPSHKPNGRFCNGKNAADFICKWFQNWLHWLFKHSFRHSFVDYIYWCLWKWQSCVMKKSKIVYWYFTVFFCYNFIVRIFIATPTFENSTFFFKDNLKGEFLINWILTFVQFISVLCMLNIFCGSYAAI